jgi:osmoprotectant transport system permease protein
MFSFLWENRAKLLEQMLEHTGLTFLSLLLAALVAIPLGIYISRKRSWAGPVLGFTGILQTLPSIALLGFLIPLLGIGVKPALFALFLYALLPILRNTYTGIQGVDEAITEAARGMGMTDGQVLRKVELPLALPVIFAGIRTATVINVGVATLAAYIGAGGLGEFIFGGIALNNSQMILAGAIPAALLALLFDQGLALLQKRRQLGQHKGLQGLVLLLVLSGLLSLLPAWLVPGLRAGFDTEFMGRADGYPTLAERYGLNFNTLVVSSALMYPAIDAGEVDLIGGYSTDGRIEAYDLVLLEDDRNVFPPYYCAPLVRQSLLERHPEVVEALELLSGKISDSTMTALNFRVDFDKESPEAVARSFLQEQGLWRPDRQSGGEVLTIGSKIFTEQYILTELFAQLINGYTDFDVDRKPGLGGTKICFEALQQGEIDLYPEYTGTGFQVILSPADDVVRSLITDREGVYDYVRKGFAEQYDLLWLSPLGFNNTYALMVREEMAEAQGWEKISDLR